jgi:hypothetical protein
MEITGKKIKKLWWKNLISFSSETFRKTTPKENSV